MKPELGPIVGLAVHRQQLAIAPQIVRPAFDHLARDERPADARVIVNHFERAEAGFAYVQRADRIFLAAFAALQIGEVTHRRPLTGARAARPQRLGSRAPHAHPERARYCGHAHRAPRCAVVGEHLPASAGVSPPRSHRSASAACTRRSRRRPADDSGFAAARDLGLVGRVLEQAAQARGVPRNHRHRLAGHPEHAAIDERRPGSRRNIVDQKLGRGTVGPVDDEIEAGDDLRPRWHASSADA